MALEPLLVDRLRQALPDSVHVLATRELADLVEGTQPTPAVHVLYRGYRPVREKTAGYEEIELIWWTVVAVRNAATVTTGESARIEAGPIMGAVVRTLGPWVPELPGYGSLCLDAAPLSGYRAGFGYFPIGWRVHARMRVAPNRRST